MGVEDSHNPEFIYLDGELYHIEQLFKEEINMDIPGKLREDLKRIYGPIDPLNCIEDIVITEDCEQTLINVTLRVPRSCDAFALSSDIRRAPRSLEYWAREQAMMCGLVSPKLSEQEIADIRKIVEGPCHPHTFSTGGKKAEATNKKDTIDFVKPERVVFSGPKTILFWPDGTKTMVSLMKGQEADPYTAFCAAITKKMFGSTLKAKKFLEKVGVEQTRKVKKPKTEEM